jgi:SAM-dependent methyltransferase
MQTKEVQGKLWSTSPADWAQYIEPTFIPMYQSVLKELDLTHGHSILDAGCGSGLFLSMAKTKGATVYGIDAALGLLEISRKRLPGTVLLLEDLEMVPFGDETFDFVTGFNSFQYAGSFENALSEARRVAKPNGKIIIGIWDKEADCESSRILKDVVSLLPPPPPGTPGPFELSEDGKIESICEKVGLKVIKKESVLCPWSFYTSEGLLKAFLCTAAFVKASQIAGQEKVQQTILENAKPFKLAEDVYFMRNHFTWYITEKNKNS